MSSPSIRSTLPAAILLALSGWGGLAYLILFVLPTLWARWMFFFLLVLGAAGVLLPVMAFLNRRFPTQPPADENTLLRESSLAGIYLAALAWLQLGQALSLPLSLLLAFWLLMIELLIRLREKSRWQP